MGNGAACQKELLQLFLKVEIKAISCMHKANLIVKSFNEQSDSHNVLRCLVLSEVE